MQIRHFGGVKGRTASHTNKPIKRFGTRELNSLFERGIGRLNPDTVEK